MQTSLRLTFRAARWVALSLATACDSGAGATADSTGGADVGSAGGEATGGTGGQPTGGTGEQPTGGTGGQATGGTGGAGGQPTGGAGGAGGDAFSRTPGHNTAVLPDPMCPAARTAGPGPFAAGVVTLQMGETPVEIWYPVDAPAVAGLSRATYDMRTWLPPDVVARLPDADVPTFEMDAYRDAPASRAHRFGVVLFSHGLGGYRSQSSFLMSHLAQWGYVVASPEHPERGLAAVLGDLARIEDHAAEALVATRDLLAAEDARPDGPLAGRLNLEQIALAGHSMGGGAVATDIALDWADTWITLASGGFEPGPDKPLLMMGGTRDALAGRAAVQTSYDQQTTRLKRLAFVEGAGHLAFTDICAIGREKGGVLQIAVDHGVVVPALVLRLGSDGCHAEDLPPEDAWPVIRHAVTAHLLSVFPTPTAESRFDAEALACFDGHATYQQGSGAAAPGDAGVTAEPDATVAPVADAGLGPDAGVGPN